MATDKNLTGAGSTAPVGTPPPLDIKQDEPQVNDAPLTGPGSTVDGGVVPTPDLEVTPTPEPTPTPAPTGPTPEQQAEFDRQQAEADQRLIDQGIDPQTGEPFVKEEVTPTPTPKVEEPAPTPTPLEKVETAEDVKSKQLDIQAKEQDQITKEQENITNTFDAAIRSGNFETARNLAIENPDLRDIFNSQTKAFLGNKANADFFKEFVGMSNEQMLSEVQNGNLVVGSERYKLLPPEQRQSFEAFKTQSDSISIQKRTDFTTDNNKTLSLEDLVTQMKDLFSTDLRTRYNEALNSKEINDTAKGLESIQNDISSIDDELDRIEDDVRKEFPTLEESKQNKIIRDRRKNIIREKNTLVNQYNAKLGTYRTLKDQAQVELDFLKFEDAQNKQIYQTALGLYETRRAEMRDDEKLAFQEKSKQLAFERSVQSQKDLIEFKNNLDKENISGKWQALQDGLYFLKDDGTATKVLGGEKVNETKKDKIRVSEWKNDDGTITVSMTNEDTQENSVFTKDAFGNITYPNGVALNGTDLRSLQNKYPGQAWAKNNNSSGITWGAASDKLKGEWAENGIAFSQGTKRPKEEGGNYVQFPTIQDGLAAHAITLGRKTSSIQNGLAQWVGTPNRATNLAYAQDLYEESGITKPITTPLNKLTDGELYSLMKAQIKRESPGLYSEMRQKGWLGEGKFNIPVKVEETATYTSNINNLLNVILPPKTNEFSRKSLSFGSRMADSVGNILELEKTFSERGTLGQEIQTWSPNFLKDESQQLFETYKENFITASLRLESGAAIAADEFDREERKFFPIPGDTIETIKAKQRQRENAIQLMLGNAGRDEDGTPVRDYYTPNNINEIWANKGGSNSESKVDEWLQLQEISIITPDPVLDSIFANGQSINQTSTGAGTTLSSTTLNF